MRITLSVMPTALTAPITSGDVRVDGAELEIFTPKTTDENSRAMLERRFDVAEMSVAAFTKALELGIGLRAIPVFTSGRRFVQSGMYLSKPAGLTSPKQLAGRGVGLPQYWVSSCVWQRHVLEEMHGLTPQQVRWVAVEPERFDTAPPEGVQLRTADQGDLTGLMASGQIDACFLQGGRPLPPGLAELVVPAYPDIVAAERAYYERSGVLPLMHVTVMRQELADAEPGLVAALLAAYAKAKDVALADPGTQWPLPPAGHDATALRALVGDPWPLGVSANRKSLSVFLDAAAAQGLTRRRYAADELFTGGLPAEYA